MKVNIRLIDLEVVVPELIPAFRSLADRLPVNIEIEASPTVDSEQEHVLRNKYSQYWEGLTMTEWKLFVHLFVHRDSPRAELKVITHGDYIAASEEGYKISNVVDVHIKNLRHRLHDFGNKHHILTKRGWGYFFRDGADPEERTSVYHKPRNSLSKNLNEDGSLKERTWRRSKNILNSVEFGYLKEMKMDDISKEEVSKLFGIEGKALDWAWEAKDYDKYSSATFLENLK